MKRQDRKILRKLLSKYVPPTAKILDIGCGIGDNISLIREAGYAEVVGVDISKEMVAKTRVRGFEAYDVQSFADSWKTKFNLLLFSHVLEHIEYKNLQAMLEGYFRTLESSSGSMVVLGPTLHSRFFSNVDHVRPYCPKGLVNMFTDKEFSRQYSSEWRIYLKDIYFRREPLRIDFMRARYLKDARSKFITRTFSHFFQVLATITFGLATHTTGYGAIYDVWKDKSAVSSASQG